MGYGIWDMDVNVLTSSSRRVNASVDLFGSVSVSGLGFGLGWRYGYDWVLLLSLVWKSAWELWLRSLTGWNWRHACMVWYGVYGFVDTVYPQGAWSGRSGRVSRSRWFYRCCLLDSQSLLYWRPYFVSCFSRDSVVSDFYLEM